MIVTVGDKGLTAITGERICTLSATFVATANSKPTIFPKLYLYTSYSTNLPRWGFNFISDSLRGV